VYLWSRINRQSPSPLQAVVSEFKFLTERADTDIYGCSCQLWTRLKQHTVHSNSVHSSFQPNTRALACNSMAALKELWFLGVEAFCRWHIWTYKEIYRSVGRTTYRQEYLLRFSNSDCCPVCVKEMALGHVSGNRPYTYQPSHTSISHEIGARLTTFA